MTRKKVDWIAAIGVVVFCVLVVIWVAQDGQRNSEESLPVAPALTPVPLISAIPAAVADDSQAPTTTPISMPTPTSTPWPIPAGMACPPQENCGLATPMPTVMPTNVPAPTATAIPTPTSTPTPVVVDVLVQVIYSWPDCVPVQGAMVEIRLANGQVHTSTTDANGGFRLTNLTLGMQFTATVTPQGKIRKRYSNREVSDPINLFLESKPEDEKC